MQKNKNVKSYSGWDPSMQLFLKSSCLIMLEDKTKMTVYERNTTVSLPVFRKDWTLSPLDGEKSKQVIERQ